MVALLLIAGTSLGFAIGVLMAYVIGVRPLVNDIRQMRYDGFKTVPPLPPRPKSIPQPPLVRED